MHFMKCNNLNQRINEEFIFSFFFLKFENSNYILGKRYLFDVPIIGLNKSAYGISS